MKKTLLVFGIACASFVAAAQSDARQEQSGEASSVTSSRDQATGQASGKRMHKPLPVARDVSVQNDVTTAREAGSGMATGKTAQAPLGTHHDGVIHRDLAAREASSGQATGVQSPRDLATGQASGKAAVTGSKPMASDDWDAQQKNGMSGVQSNPMYNGSTSSGSNPLYQGKDRVAAGDVNGDGAAARATKTRSNIQNNRVATGDVNGDGAADVSVSANGQSQMKAEPSRGHQPDRQSSDASAGKGASDKKPAPRDAASGQASGKRQPN
jgi:hypothetical protein